jgi:hypothetical protein
MWWDGLRSEVTWEVEVVPAQLRTTHGANLIRPNARTTLTSQYKDILILSYTIAYKVFIFSSTYRGTLVQTNQAAR